MHNLLIYNPVSGKYGGKRHYLGNIVGQLTQKGEELTIYQTQGPGDVISYLKKNYFHYDKVICCGGDGTLHEVVNGLLQNNIQTLLGYIPRGSTNDYAKNLRINSKNALKCIADGKAMNIDVGNFNGEYFTYVAACGAFTNIPFITPQKTKNVLGYYAYLLEGIKHLSDIRPIHIKCEIKNTVVEDDVCIGMITNALSVAGIKNRNCEITRLDDGLLEYMFVKMPRNPVELQATISSLLSEKVDNKYMYSGQSGHLKIYSEGIDWTLDGENGGFQKEVEINVCSKALKLIVGKLQNNLGS